MKYYGIENIGQLKSNDLGLVNLITNSGFGVWSNGTAENVGSELITNGEFTTNTNGWTAIASASIASVAGGQSGNCCQMTGGGAEGYDAAYQQVTTVVGKLYKLSGYIKSGTQGAVTAYVQVMLNDDATMLARASGTTSGSWVQISVVFEATQTDHYIQIQIPADMGANTSLFDTISLYEITPGCVAADALGPDGWEKSASIDVYREHEGSNTKDGAFYSCKLYKATGSASYDFYWPSARSGNIDWHTRFASRTVTFGVWVKGSTAGKVNLYIRDASAANATSSTNVGTGFEWLEVTMTIASAAATFHCGVQIDASAAAQTVYISQAMLIFGNYIGADNYQPIPNEFIHLEKSPGGYIYDASSALVNIEAYTSGAIPKGVKSIYGRWVCNCSGTGETFYFGNAASATLTSPILRTLVSGLAHEIGGFIPCTAEGNTYLFKSGGTSSHILYIMGVIL
jgi:hypothetical protein